MWTHTATDTPIAVYTPDRREWLKLFLTTTTKSGPGVTIVNIVIEMTAINSFR